MKSLKQLFTKYIVSILAFCGFGILHGIYRVIQYSSSSYAFKENLYKGSSVLFFIGVGLFFVEAVFSKKWNDIKHKFLYVLGKVAAYIGVLFVSGILKYFSGLDGEDIFLGINGELLSSMADKFSTGYILLMIILGVYFVYCQKKKNLEKFSFEVYASRVFANLCISFIIYLILTFGGALVFTFMAELLLNGSGKITDLWIYFILFGYFPSAVLYSLIAVDKESGKFVKAISRYILPILTICAFFIVYIYLAKILIQWTIPSNEVFYIISGLFCLGMPSWLLAEGYKDKSFYSKVISAFSYIFAPLIFVQSYCIGVRIFSYGMTTGRYLGVMLIVFEVAAILVGLICKKRRELYLLMIAGLVAISVYAPKFNMYSFSNMWQYYSFMRCYEKVEAGYEITAEEYERLVGAFTYLRKQPETTAICKEYDIYSDDFVVKLVKSNEVAEDITEIRNIYSELEFVMLELDISQYNHLSLYRQSDIYSVGWGDTIENLDLENFEMVSMETEETISVDISAFIEKCIELEASGNTTSENMRQKLSELNVIPVDENRDFYIQSYYIHYKDGVKEGEPYFVWECIKVNGYLLDKNANEQYTFAEEWKTAYCDELALWEDNRLENPAYDIDTGYFLCDLSGDLVPELIRYENISKAEETRGIRVYAYVNGKVELLEDISLEEKTNFYALPDGQGLLLVKDNDNRECIGKLTMNNGKVVLDAQAITKETYSGYAAWEMGYEWLTDYDYSCTLPLVEYGEEKGFLFGKKDGIVYQDTYEDYEKLIDTSQMVHVIFARQNRNKDLGEMQLKDLLKPGVLVSEDNSGLEMEKDYCTSEINDKDVLFVYLKEKHTEDIKYTIILNIQSDGAYAYCLENEWEYDYGEMTSDTILHNQSEALDISFYQDEFYANYDTNHSTYMLQVEEAKNIVFDSLPNVEQIKEKLPPNIGLHTVCAGDIGEDGKKDIAVVLEYVEDEAKKEFYPILLNDRLIFIYTQTEDGKYECKFQDYQIVSNKNFGGIYGDPFSGISIEDGLFTVTHYGGSSDRWGNTEYFKLLDGQLVLCKLEELEYSTHELIFYRTIYDYETGIKNEYSQYWDEEEAVQLSSEKFEVKTILFGGDW